MLTDRMVTRVLAPEWMLQGRLCGLSKRRFVGLSFRVAAWLRRREAAQRNGALRDYLNEAMHQMTEDELGKVFDAVHRFDCKRSKAVSAPALIVIGDHEPHHVRTHAQDIKAQFSDAVIRTMTL